MIGTCAFLVQRPGSTILATCGKEAVALIGRLEVCAEHQRMRAEKKTKQPRITKFGDLE